MDPKMNELWVARVRYWPGDKERLIVVKIYYVWKDGRIQFVPIHCLGEGDPIWEESCDQFELVRKVEL